MTPKNTGLINQTPTKENDTLLKISEKSKGQDKRNGKQNETMASLHNQRIFLIPFLGLRLVPSLCTTISTLRFIALRSSVSLSTTG